MGLLWLQERERRKLMPLPKSKDKSTFEELDAPEYWVEYKIMGGLRFEEAKRLSVPEEDQSDQDYVETMFTELITGWNIPEVDGGDPMPIPSVDKSSVGNLPNSFVTFIISKITDTPMGDTENLDGDS